MSTTATSTAIRAACHGCSSSAADQHQPERGAGDRLAQRRGRPAQSSEDADHGDARGATPPAPISPAVMCRRRTAAPRRSPRPAAARPTTAATSDGRRGRSAASSSGASRLHATQARREQAAPRAGSVRGQRVVPSAERLEGAPEARASTRRRSASRRCPASTSASIVGVRRLDLAHRARRRGGWRERDVEVVEHLDRLLAHARRRCCGSTMASSRSSQSGQAACAASGSPSEHLTQFVP